MEDGGRAGEKGGKGENKKPPVVETGGEQLRRGREGPPPTRGLDCFVQFFSEQHVGNGPDFFGRQGVAGFKKIHAGAKPVPSVEAEAAGD